MKSLPGHSEPLSQKIHAADNVVSSGALLGLLNSKLGGSFCLPAHDEGSNQPQTASEPFAIHDSAGQSC